MRAVIQRVTEASVTVDGETVGAINQGLLIFVGIEETDIDDDIHWLSGKIVNMRIFNDENQVMNRSVIDIDGAILVISQFTLHASTRKGNRPSYSSAAKPTIAIPIYERFLHQLEADVGNRVERGIFGADMKVRLLNDGPVTILIDTKNRE